MEMDAKRASLQVLRATASTPHLQSAVLGPLPPTPDAPPMPVRPHEEMAPTNDLINGTGKGTQKRLFDCVLVVGMNAKMAPDAKNPPYVQYHFPYPPSFMKAVTQFCFPDTALDKMKKEEIFSFVLTEGNGEKRWGYCHRLFPQCFCIVSYLPCFSIFSKILNKVIKLHQNAVPGLPFSTCTVFLRAIYEQPLPPPGGTLQFTVEYPMVGGKKAKTENYTFRRPDDSDSLLDHVNFRPLLSLLSPDNILATFASLLVERRIIFISERVSTLSACVQACVAVLYPFSWQHVFIPVLPASLLSFCCAPMPFVVGVLRSSVEELTQMSRNMEEVVIVDLDDDKVIPPGKDTDAVLLPPFVAPLRATIEEISRRVRTRVTLTNLTNNAKRKLPKDSTNALANAFIGFMVDLLSSYRNYIVNTPGDADEASFPEFRREDFLNEARAEVRPLLELMTETQMFNMFIEQRAGAQLDNGAFDRGITEKTPDKNNEADFSGTDGSGSSSGDNNATRTSQRMRPAHTRFTMYEYGNISRSEISAVHEMLREHSEKTKKDIEEQESLELLRKWREEEKERKEKEIAAKAETEAREGKKSTIEIADQRSTPPSSSVEASGVSTMTLDERAQGRGDGFHSIRVSSEDIYKNNPGNRQSFLAASRMTERGTQPTSPWKRAHVSPASPTSPTRASFRCHSYPSNLPGDDDDGQGSGGGSESRAASSSNNNGKEAATSPRSEEASSSSN